MKRIVFISHSSADVSVAERACAYLEKNGVPCWMAPRDVMPGKNYGAAIIDAIDECQVFVLILSSQSNKSRQVVREVERAASTDSVILPFRIEDVQPSRDLAFYVSAAQWLDAAKHPVDEQFDELLAAIRNWQQTTADSENVPAPTPAPPVPPAIASTPVPAATPSRFPIWLGLTIAAAAAVVAIGGFFLYKSSHQMASSSANPPVAAETSVPPPSPISSTPEPTATAPEVAEASPTPMETPITAPIAEATPPPIRLKPGERIRPATTPEAAVQSPQEFPPVTTNSPSLPPASRGPIVREVAASSQFNSEFRPNLAFDGNPATSWVPKGRAIGQSLIVNFKAPAVVRSVSILNGDGRDEEHYRESNRVKGLRIILSEGTNQLFTFKDEMKMQRFELQKPVTATWAKFEIVSVFPGTKIKRAGISEIAFNEDER